jgi:hypothetical protein
MEKKEREREREREIRLIDERKETNSYPSQYMNAA